VGLEEVASKEVGVFVGLEVREAQDHGTGPERRRQGPYPLRKPVDEELALVLVAAGEARDLELDLGRE
jgi:hypothetical protein